MSKVPEFTPKFKYEKIIIKYVNTSCGNTSKIINAIDRLNLYPDVDNNYWVRLICNYYDNIEIFNIDFIFHLINKFKLDINYIVEMEYNNVSYSINIALKMLMHTISDNFIWYKCVLKKYNCDFELLKNLINKNENLEIYKKYILKATVFKRTFLGN